MRSRFTFLFLLAIAITTTIGVVFTGCVGDNQAAPASNENRNADVAVPKGGDDRTGPYDVVPGWWKPAPNHDDEWGWGQVAGVAVDNPNRILVVTRGDWPKDRSVPRNNRLRRTNFIVAADRDGNIVEQWTQWDSMLTLPHQIYISPYDRERHVWVIDSGGGEGDMQVLKFTNDGKELSMKLGEKEHPKTRDEARANKTPGPYTYGWPSKLAFLPDGSFLLADGYWNSRIIKYTPEGKYVMEWGATGKGPGEFDLLHGLAVDEDRVYVGDRQNSRIQLFTHEGKFLEEWPDIFDPVNIWVDESHAVWVLDASLNRLSKYSHDGVLQYHWGAYAEAGTMGRNTWPGGLSLPHQMDMDGDGNLYIASYSGGWVDKFVPKAGADPARLVGKRLRLSDS
jgi:hypothetical protein